VCKWYTERSGICLYRGQYIHYEFKGLGSPRCLHLPRNMTRPSKMQNSFPYWIFGLWQSPDALRYVAAVVRRRVGVRSRTDPKNGPGTQAKLSSIRCVHSNETELDDLQEATIKTGIPILWQELLMFRRQRYRQTNKRPRLGAKPSWVTGFFHLKFVRLLFVIAASLTASTFRQGMRVQLHSQPGIWPFHHRIDTVRIAWDRMFVSFVTYISKDEVSRLSSDFCTKQRHSSHTFI
jgi:hypothetical protein